MQRGKLCLCKRAAFRYETVGKGFVHGKIHGYLIKVLLILSGRGSPEPYGVAVIVGCQSRHDRIKIDDAQGFSRVRIQKDIVQLGVIMSDPGGKRPAFAHPHQRAALFFPVQEEFDLFLYRSRPSAAVCFQRFPKEAVAVDGIVEPRDRLYQGIDGKIAELSLKPAKSYPALIEIRRTLRRLKAQGMFDKFIDPPVFSLIA